MSQFLSAFLHLRLSKKHMLSEDGWLLSLVVGEGGEWADRKCVVDCERGEGGHAVFSLSLSSAGEGQFLTGIF